MLQIYQRPCQLRGSCDDSKLLLPALLLHLLLLFLASSQPCKLANLVERLLLDVDRKVLDGENYVAEYLSVGVGGGGRGAIDGKVDGGEMPRVVRLAARRDVEDRVEAAVSCLVVHLDALNAAIKQLRVWEALVIYHNVGHATVDQLLPRLLVDQADAKSTLQLQHQLKFTLPLFPLTLPLLL